MVTHEPDDMKYVSRVVWLNDGELTDKLKDKEYKFDDQNTERNRGR